VTKLREADEVLLEVAREGVTLIAPEPEPPFDTQQAEATIAQVG
jgi:hypothetical protein